MKYSEIIPDKISYIVRNDREAKPLSALPFHLTTFKIMPYMLIAKENIY